MRTEPGQQTSGPAGSSGFTYTGPDDVRWTVRLVWSLVRGRVECTSLTLDSDGQAPVTSGLVRDVERQVRAERARRAETVAKIARDWSDRPVGQRAAAQLPAYERQDRDDAPERRPGRRVHHEQWLQRAQAVHAAYVAHGSMLQALAALDPHAKPDTLRKRLDRTHAWAREHVPNLAVPTTRRTR